MAKVTKTMVNNVGTTVKAAVVVTGVYCAVKNCYDAYVAGKMLDTTESIINTFSSEEERTSTSAKAYKVTAAVKTIAPYAAKGFVIGFGTGAAYEGVDLAQKLICEHVDKSED